MVRTTVTGMVLTLLLSITASGQAPNKGVFHASATLVPALALKLDQHPVLVHGFLAYYVQDNVALRGDGYIQPSPITQGNYLIYQHSLFYGAAYHRTSNGFDAFLGLQPGATYVLAKNEFEVGALDEQYNGAVPVVSAIGGMNYFAHPNFSFFLHLRYTKGSFYKGMPDPVHLDDLRLSAGLAFSVDVIK